MLLGSALRRRGKKEVLVKEKLNCDTLPKKAFTHSMGSEIGFRVISQRGKEVWVLNFNLSIFRCRLPMEESMTLGKTNIFSKGNL